MKYEVELTRHEVRTVEVFADTPEAAVKLAQGEGFRAELVTEVLAEDECGESFEVVGGCEACGLALFNPEYRSDIEGVTFCVRCFDEMVAAEA